MTKTTRIMLAVIAACGASAALAQSSVNIYGRVNTSLEHRKVGTLKTIGLHNNSSRIGFLGSEDLGNGLKLGFQLEAGFRSDDGQGPLDFTRQSEVNLSGNFGTVRLGTFTAASYEATADYVSMHNHDTGISADALYDYNMRDSNKIAYRTPNLSGFTAEVAYSFHEKQPGQSNAVDLALNYSAGALALGAGYSQQGDDNQFALRGLYTVDQFTFGGYVQRSDSDVNGTRNNFRLAAMYTVGASEFHINAGRAGKWKKVANATNSTQWTLGYNHNLSKRTKVYTFFTQNKVSDVKTRSIALGLRHNF